MANLPPSTIPTWGTAVAGGDIATPNNSELASGIVKVGSPAIPQKLPYQWFNWLMVWICAWIDYLSYGTVVYGGTNTNFNTFAANTYDLTITNFPSNANIAQGCIVEWVAGVNDSTGAGNDNTGAVNVSINGGANIQVFDQNSNQLVGYDIVGGRTYQMIFVGSVFIIPNYLTGVAPSYWGGTTDTGTANANAITCAGFPKVETGAGFQPIKNGTQVSYYPANNNTTATTITIKGGVAGAAKAIKQPGGSALTSGMLVANTLAVLIWDGGNGYWILTNPSGA